MTALYRTPQVPHLKIYYWLNADWTFDKSEADLIDDGLESASLHGTAYFPIGAPPELIDAEIKLLVVNQRPSREGVITRAINRSF